MNGVWQKAADRMRDSLGQVGYETWICPLNFLGLQDKTATIEVPNRFFRDYMTDKYLELLRQSLSAEVGEPVDINQPPNPRPHKHTSPYSPINQHNPNHHYSNTHNIYNIYYNSNLSFFYF